MDGKDKRKGRRVEDKDGGEGKKARKGKNAKKVMTQKRTKTASSINVNIFNGLNYPSRLK